MIVKHDKEERTVPTRASTKVGDLLNKLDISVRAGDVVEPAADTEINQDEFRINVYRAKPVAIMDSGRQMVGYSAATTPRSIVNQAGGGEAPLTSDDNVVSEPVTNFLADGTFGQKIIVDRAKPIAVNLYGNQVNLRTHANTVGEFLEEKNIQLGKDDTVQPAADVELNKDSQVFVLRKGVQITSVTENIPQETQIISDPSLALGTKAVRQQGSAGKRILTYQVSTQNGKETSRQLIQTVVSQAPITQIEVHGTSLSGIKGNMALAGISPSDFTYVDYIVSHESRWNPYAKNASGATGLCQALPGSKMASAGADWATNPVTQLKWCSGYAQGRYGSWRAAYNFWQSHHYW